MPLKHGPVAVVIRGMRRIGEDNGEYLRVTPARPRVTIRPFLSPDVPVAMTTPNPDRPEPHVAEAGTTLPLQPQEAGGTSPYVPANGDDSDAPPGYEILGELG